MSSNKAIAFGCIGLFGLGALVVGGFILYYWNTSDINVAAKDLPNQLRLARSEGIPLDAADLKRNPPVAPADNAAAPIRAFHGELARLTGETKALAAILSPKSSGPKEMAAAIAAIPSCKRLFALTAEAARRPDCDFERDWSQGPAVLFPEDADMKAAVKAMAGRSLVEEHEGMHEAAWKSLETAAAVGRHAGADRCLIGFLVQCACDAIVVRAAQRLVVEQKGLSAAVTSAQSVVRALGPAPDVRWSYGGEIVMNRRAIDWIRRTRDLKTLLGGADFGDGRRIPVTPRACDAYEARLLEISRKTIAALPANLDGWQASDSQLKVLATTADSDRRPSQMLNAILYIDMRDPIKAATVDIERRRLLLAGALVYAYRRTHGSFPEALPALGRDGIDIMDGKPLRYRRTGDSFLLYGVGRDGSDDGGQPLTTPRPNHYDELFGAG